MSNPSFIEEYKYYIPLTTYPHLLEDLKRFTKNDDNAKQNGGFYDVTSIYFETIKLKSYHDSIEGLAKRVKLRLRFYPLDVRGKFNIEFKHKLLDKYLKKKVCVDYDWLLKIINDDIDLNDYDQNSILYNFLSIKKINNFYPFIKIDYKRQALFAKNDHNIRITFDSDLKCNRILGEDLGKAYVPIFPSKTIIMEIKTHGYFPYWLAYIIKKYSIQRDSISKYALAVQNLSINSSLYLK